MSDADFSDKFTHQVYEVISEDTKKYSSTHVSGGGGSVSGYGGYVSGSTDAVTSRVDYHSDQSVWVKNVDTGKERKFQLNTFNIDVRPGHKVLCVWDKKADRLERVVNLDTGDVSYADGVQQFYNSPLRSPSIEWIVILFGLTMPLFGWLMLFVIGSSFSVKKGLIFKKEKMPGISIIKKFFKISPVVMIVLYFVLLQPMSSDNHFHIISVFYPVAGLIGATLGSGLLIRQYESEMLIKESSVSAFNDYINSLTKKYTSS